ncbi:exonuclease domain-containing protein [Micromonospora sp. NPDC003197]
MINRYPGKCAQCRGPVAAGAGQAINESGRWQTYHNDCAPVRTAPKAGGHHGWHREPLVAFDIETTLPEPMDARIISAALVYANGHKETWLINPGVRIPPEATELNGITDEVVRLKGQDPTEALAAISLAITKEIAKGTPLVAFFAPFDVTTIHHELARHGMPGIDWEQATIIDPFVLHKEVEPNWYAPSKLGDLCEYYQVPLERAHEAASDAQATLELAQSIGARHPHIARMQAPTLHAAQVEWFAKHSAELQRYYDRQGIDKFVSTEWPLETVPRR